MDDIPSPENCLHGAFIHSTKPFARVKDVKFESKALPDGVTDIILFRDIPKRGENIGCKTPFGDEPLFADDLTRYAGQPVAFVVNAFLHNYHGDINQVHYIYVYIYS